jgi:membrane-anchored protein YejM (alkaline phosphatase superfamily)
LIRGFDEFNMDTKTNTASTLIDKGIAWVGNRKKRPFFLFLHLFDVHEYTSPAKYDERYQDADYKGKLKGDLWLLRSLRYLPENLSDADLQYIIAKYDGAISYVDSELGRLFAWLR